MLVVLMHTLRHLDKTVSNHPYLYYLTRCSMPLFFMVSGAVQLNKSTLTFSYSKRKIFQILLVMMGYYLIDLCVRIVINSGEGVCLHHIICQAKVVYHDFPFWFLRTMIYIYALLPFLHKLFKKNATTLVLALGVITIVINSISIWRIFFSGADVYLQSNVPQEFRMWTWLFYFCLGGLIYKYRLSQKIQNTNAGFLTLLSILLTYTAIMYMNYILRLKTGIVNGEYAYDSIILMLWSSSLMILCLRLNLIGISGVLNYAASLLMPIYALHILVLQSIEDNLVFHSYYMQLIAFFIVLSITILLGGVMKIIPGLKRLTYI